MRLWPRRNRKIKMTTTECDARPTISAVAGILRQNPEIMRGYLVVGFRIDGTVAIAHNSCCAPHLVSQTIDEIAKYPELQKPRGKSHESHDS